MSASVLAGVDLTVRPRRRRRLPVSVVASFALLAAVLVCAVLGAGVAPYDPNAQDLALGLSGPSRAHPFGTDDLGRDILSRTVAGARTGVVGPALVALGAMVIGAALGLWAGYRGGAVDAVVMRWVEVMFALPGLLVVVVVAGVLGGGYLLAVGVLVVLSSPWETRMSRGIALEQRSRPYVEAARALGVPAHRIVARHIWPNALPILTADAFLNFAMALVVLSGLSFLGLGVGPGAADWGRMLAENRVLLAGNPLAALAPGVFIVLTATAMNLVGDWTYERLTSRGRSR